MGHNRYSTTGGTTLRNVQPLFAHLEHGGMAVAHNGNLTNAMTIHDQLIKAGSIYQSTSDTEVILHLMARARGTRVVERFIEAIRQLEGAYALVAISDGMMIGARDPVGIRPLVLGRKDGGYVLASETCALDIIGATFVREIANGEVVVITDAGVESHTPFPPRRAQPCIFEYIYFARPDSVIDGQSVYEVRKRMGATLAREAHVDADIVVPVPDSGVPASLGYAQATGIPFELGIIRSTYSRRTFIEPAQQIRQLGVKLKLAANAAVIRGKRIILIDDSVVRGTTSEKLVRMMRDAGAAEVHMRIACPEIKYGDYYGIDTPTRDELWPPSATRNKCAITWVQTVSLS
jgi:amidophosphoribosyltransferase